MDGVGGACGEDGGVGGSPGVGAVCLAEERPDGRQFVHHERFPEAEAPTDSDYLSLLRYLSFFSFR